MLLIIIILVDPASIVSLVIILDVLIVDTLIVGYYYLVDILVIFDALIILGIFSP